VQRIEARRFSPWDLVAVLLLISRSIVLSNLPLIVYGFHVFALTVDFFYYNSLAVYSNFTSLFWRCWLGNRKGIQLVKKQL